MPTSYGDPDRAPRFFEMLDRLDGEVASGQGADRDGIRVEHCGNQPIVFSAPHAVRCGEHLSDRSTGSLALVLARLLGGTAVVMVGNHDRDVDPLTVDSHPFKERIRETRSRGARLVVDFHGMTAETARSTNCELGLGLGTRPTVHSGFLAEAYRSVASRFNRSVVSGNRHFAALRPTSITMYARGLGLHAIQVELHPDLRDGDDVQAQYQCAQIHYTVARLALENLARLDWLQPEFDSSEAHWNPEIEAWGRRATAGRRKTADFCRHIMFS